MRVVPLVFSATPEPRLTAVAFTVANVVVPAPVEPPRVIEPVGAVELFVVSRLRVEFAAVPP